MRTRALAHTQRHKSRHGQDVLIQQVARVDKRLVAAFAAELLPAANSLLGGDIGTHRVDVEVLFKRWPGHRERVGRRLGRRRRQAGGVVDDDAGRGRQGLLDLGEEGRDGRGRGQVGA